MTGWTPQAREAAQAAKRMKAVHGNMDYIRQRAHHGAASVPYWLGGTGERSSTFTVSQERQHQLTDYEHNQRRKMVPREKQLKQLKKLMKNDD